MTATPGTQQESRSPAETVGAPADQAPRPAPSPAHGTIRVAIWRDGQLAESEGLAAVGECRTPGTAAWIDAVDLDAEGVEAIGRVLGLHPLIAEDILEGNQRAKIELTDELIHIVLFSLDVRHPHPCEIDIVLGSTFLLTVHEADWDPRDNTHLRDGLGPVLARGPDHLLWALVDQVVDGYFPFIDRLADEIEGLEDRVVASPTPETLDALFSLKRRLLEIRRAATPTREVFNQLTNRDLPLIDDEEVLYFRDVYDHLIRLTDELDSYRELVSGILEVYLSTINNNLSLIMKRLTGVTVIVAGIGAIAGIFGMSEAGTALGGAEASGFWLVTATTIALAVGAWAVLRRIGWI
jgi:magnesium transporter